MIQLTRTARAIHAGAIVATLTLTAAVSSAQERMLTPADVATIESVSAAQISPDGRHVAWIQSVPRTLRDEEDGSARSELWVLDRESSEKRPYVTAESGVSRVHWTPDGLGIAFLAKRDGDEHEALYVIPLAGGEASRTASFDDRAINSYAFSSDGKRLALLATAPKGEEREKDEEHGFKPEVYEEDWRPAELWIADAAGEDEKTRLEIEGHVSAVVWSPDDRHLAIAAAPTALVDDSYVAKRIRVVDAESGAVTARIENGGKLGAFEWSPDGSGLAMIAGAHENDGAAARLLWAALPDSGGSVVPRRMLPDHERDEHDIAWLPDGSLVVLGSRGVWSTLDRYGVVDGKAVRGESLLPLQGPALRGMSVSRNGEHTALVASTPEHPTELFTLNSAGELRRRTNSNSWLSEISLGVQEVVRYEARDGLPIEGVLIRPIGSEGPAPLLVVVHGGPEAHHPNGWLTGYSYPGQIAAGQGYASFYPNYRGSTGRGLAYLQRSQGDPAGKEFDDVVDGVDRLVELAIADTERVGVTGGSYGGFATAWFSTYYSDRFAAGVMFVGISDNISKVGTTDIPEEMYLVHHRKRPWEDWQFFLERSPIYHADGANTPLLILHGKDDTRVDPGQSREMYRHLKLRGDAPVRLVQYPGEGHGNRKAGARFDYSVRMMRWFDHYLRREGGEPPSWEIDYDEHLPSEEEVEAPGP